MPAVVSAPARWNPSWIATKAPPCADEQDGDEQKPEAAVYDRLRRDVACRVEEACRDPEPGARRDRNGRHRRDECEQHGERQPAGERARRRRAAPRGAAREGDGEQQEARDGEADGEPLAAGEVVSTPVDQHREEADASGRGGLDERQRSERERRDVEHPAAHAREEACQPGPVAKQRAERADRRPQRQRGQLRRGAVLGEPTPVERERRAECQRQARGGGHRRSFWNGRYASAARAAMPTRGRSSRRS